MQPVVKGKSLNRAKRLLNAFHDWFRSWFNTANRPSPTPRLERIRRIRLAEGVSRALFEEFTDHRRSSRGHEETGWLLLGRRDGDEAIALATLPAGAHRQAGVAHVRFDSTAQALASRIVRQSDKRLVPIGVVHTHPGRLRHPSEGDFQGDSQWVAQLRGQEGVFGIGTADNEIHWSWYALAVGDRNYRPMATERTDGSDLADSLRPVWDLIERHADRLDRLARQQAQLLFDVVDGPERKLLAVTVPLADKSAVRMLVGEVAARFFVFRDGDLLAADVPDVPLDQGLYLLLAELAGRG